MTTLSLILLLFKWLAAILIICLTSYLLLYKNKLDKLNPSGQRCYHINKLPSIISLLPKFILFSIIKSQGKPLSYCKLELPIKQQKQQENKEIVKNRPSQTINLLHGNDEKDEDKIKVYKYFSQIEVAIDSISINSSHLNSYKKLFEDDNKDDNNNDNVPICYLEAMRFSLTPYIITKDEFPLSPLGLIHIGTEIKIYDKIDIKHNYEITTSLNEIRETKKGIEIDIITYVYLNGDSNSSQLIYECIETLLSRDKKKIKKNKSRNKKHVDWKKEFKNKQNETTGNIIIKKDININDRMGIKYSEISGDINPHHLYKWSAMIVGYHKPIIHGMYSLQKSLTEIKKMFINNNDIFIYKYPLKVVSTFKLPIFIPNKVKLLTNYYSESNDYLTFALVDKNETIPHILGSIVIES